MILRVVVILLWSVAGMADVPTNLEPLSQRLEQLRQQHGVAGVSVLLVDPNQVLLDQQLGVTDWPSRIPFTAQHLYRIGSISKTFAGLLALRLQAKGLIDLDVSIQDYGVDQVENAHPNPITLTQLLEHTAGLKDLAKAEWDHNQPLSLQAAFALKLAAHRTHWPPGQHKSYSNLGAGLFGLALELKLKDSYENLLQQHVLTPLGMQRTNMLLNDEVKNSLIAGYDRDGTTPIPYWHVIYRPAAAINTNNQDMSHFLRLFLNRGQVGDTAFLHPDQMRRMQQATTTLAAQAGLRVGYGLGLSHWQVRGHDFWGHGGDADGYLSRFGFSHEAGVAYLVVINAFKHRALNDLVDVIENHIVAPLPKPQYPRRLSQNKAQMARWLGQYQAVTQRFQPGQHHNLGC